MIKLRKFIGMIRDHGLYNVLLFLKFRMVIDSIKILSSMIRFDTSKDGTSKCIEEFIGEVNKMNSPRVLEIGSRDISRKSQFMNYSEYVGFDIHAGNHVNVVGDIHQIAKYFPENHFDAVFSISVFEHLAMPWKAIVELRKVLKPGGKLLIATHPTYPPHAQPWDFWRYSRFAFTSLLNSKTGFRILKCVEGMPCVVLPLCKAKEMGVTHRVPSFLLVCVVAEKSQDKELTLSWDVDVNEVINNSYPLEYRDDVANVFFDYKEGKRRGIPNEI